MDHPSFENILMIEVSRYGILSLIEKHFSPINSVFQSRNPKIPGIGTRVHNRLNNKIP
jgi:hypothetical protein